MTMHVPNGATASMILLVTLLFTGCGTKNAIRLYHSDDIPHKSHQLAEVMALGSRADILSRPVYYQAALSAGLADRDIRDGSIGIGRVYCCGGEGTPEMKLAASFYIPPEHHVEVGDVVEFRVGKVPEDNRPGELNTVVKVRHKKGMESGACRWLPDTPPGLWMRVIYCDWMESEGWRKGGSFQPEWYKPAE